MPREPLRTPYRFYLHRILPGIATMVTGEKSAYEYLGASIEKFPAGPAMLSLISQTGFESPTCEPLSGGIVSLYTAVKPAASDR